VDLQLSLFRVCIRCLFLVDCFSVIVILIVIIGLLSIGIIYAYRTQDYEELPSDSVSPTDENTHPLIIGTSEEQQPVLESLPKIDEKSPDS